MQRLRYPLFKLILIVALETCLVLSGCRRSQRPPDWSAESKSPDGKMIATAQTFVDSGFGTGWTQTTVNLNWTTGSQPPMLILAFSDGPAGPGGMNVEMKWLSPTNLELSYKGARSLDFRAAECGGVEISLQVLPNPAVVHAQTVTGFVTDTLSGKWGANAVHAEASKQNVEAGMAVYAVYDEETHRLFVLDSKSTGTAYVGQRVTVNGTLAASAMKHAGQRENPETHAVEDLHHPSQDSTTPIGGVLKISSIAVAPPTPATAPIVR